MLARREAKRKRKEDRYKARGAPNIKPIKGKGKKKDVSIDKAEEAAKGKSKGQVKGKGQAGKTKKAAAAEAEADSGSDSSDDEEDGVEKGADEKADGTENMDPSTMALSFSELVSLLFIIVRSDVSNQKSFRKPLSLFR